jgi:putative addiction module component (TIGR02574 family)
MEPLSSHAGRLTDGRRRFNRGLALWFGCERATAKHCVGNNAGYYLLMPLTNLTVAEEALSLSPEDRAALARLLIQSLEIDSRTDAEIKAELNRRLEQLLSKKDAGLTFHEVFGRAS